MSVHPAGSGLTARVLRLAASAPADPPDLTPSQPDRLETVWQRSVPARFHGAALADLDPAVRAPVAEWAANPAGRNLLLLGPVGVGKTHAAVAALRASVDAGVSVAVWPLVELLDMLRPGGSETVMRDVTRVGVLLVDDLGAERGSEWAGEQLYRVVNRRWLDRLPTVATSNLDPVGLAEVVGERVWSRLVGSGAVVVRLSGGDRRRNKSSATC